MSYDFSTAQASGFEIIPENARVPVKIAVQAGDPGTPENCFAVTKSGLYQLVLEVVVTDGDFKGRRFWQRLTMGAQKGIEMTEGQQKGVNISAALLRSILEAARGFAPTDETPQAVAARKIASLFELDGLEFEIIVGIEKGRDGYADKNKIGKVVPFRAGGAVPTLAGKPMTPAAPVAAKPKANWA